MLRQQACADLIIIDAMESLLMITGTMGGGFAQHDSIVSAQTRSCAVPRTPWPSTDDRILVG